MYSEPAKPAEVLPPPPPPARRIVLEAPDPEAGGPRRRRCSRLRRVPGHVPDGDARGDVRRRLRRRGVRPGGRGLPAAPRAARGGPDQAPAELLRGGPPWALSPASPCSVPAEPARRRGRPDRRVPRHLLDGHAAADVRGDGVGAALRLREPPRGEPEPARVEEVVLRRRVGRRGRRPGTAAGDAAAKGRMVEIVQTHLEEKYIEFLERAPPESVHRQLDASPGPERLDAVSAAASDPPPAPPIAPGGEMYSIVETKITVSGDCSFDQADQAAATASLAASLSVDESAITLAYKCIETTAAPNECDCSSEETGCGQRRLPEQERQGQRRRPLWLLLSRGARGQSATPPASVRAPPSRATTKARRGACDADSPNGDSVDQQSN